MALPPDPSPYSSGTLSPWAPPAEDARELTRKLEDVRKNVSQVDNVVGDLKNSFDQLRAEVGAATTTFRISSTRQAPGKGIFTPSFTPSQSLTMGGASVAVSSAASACESRMDSEIAYCTRISALEATCEDLRNTLQEVISFPEATERLVRTELTDRLEPFRAELEEKLKHLTPNNLGTTEQNCDVAIPLGAVKQESPTFLGVDMLSNSVASVYAILRTDVMQEVGQLRSVIEREVRSLRSQFEVESAKVEQNVIMVSRLEAGSSQLSQRIAEIGPDVTKLRETGITSSNPNQVEFRDFAGCKDPERCSNPCNVTGFDRRLLELEAAYAAESHKSGEIKQHLSAVEHDLSQELQKAWAIVNGQISFVTQTVELLQKQYTVVEKRMNNLTASVADACASSIVKAQASLSRELVVRGVETSCGQKQQQHQQQQQRQQQEQRQTRRSEPESMKGLMRSNSIIGGAPAATANAVLSSQSLVNQPQSTQLGAELSDVVSRISALESEVTRQQSSGSIFVAQSEAKSMVPITLQANNTLTSESHPASALETLPFDVTAAGAIARDASATGPCAQPLLQGTLSASISSPTLQMSGILTASKDAVPVQSQDRGCMRRRNSVHGSLILPLKGPHGSLHGSPDQQFRILQSKGSTEFAAGRPSMYRR